MNPNYHPPKGPKSAPDDLGDMAPSRSALKRASDALQKLGKQLLDLPDSRLDAIGMPENLREALADYRRTRSFEGKRRQLQYIGKLIRSVDAEPLREAVAAFQLGHAQDALALHEAEAWRRRLIDDEKTALDDWLAQFPETDVQQLRTLVRNARKDAALTPDKRNGKAFRELFQLIKSALLADDAAEAGDTVEPEGDDE